MCSGPTWKREVVPDHKFDFVDTREFTDNGFGMRMKYLFLYITVLKSFLVYVSDIFSGITMATTKNWSNQVFDNCPPHEKNGCVYIPFAYGKWLFIGCILMSFLLLAYEGHKSKKIIASRDISYAFTNVMANHYYSLRSYDHFCFFDHISNSTKKKDDFAFFVFFTFKSWKRLLLADAPRQTINALTLYAVWLAKKDLPSDGGWDDLRKYFTGNSFTTTGLMFSMAFTTLVCGVSLLMLIAAGIAYVPLLCYIRGNLKEYVCHKVDKRIAEIIKRRNKQRVAKAAALARKEAAGDFSHLKNKKGNMGSSLPQPTLPNVSLDDDDDFFGSDAASQKTRVPGLTPSNYAQSTYTQDTYFYAGEGKGADYPPMPAYGNNQPYGQHQQGYEEEYGSTAYLAGQDQYGYAQDHEGHGQQGYDQQGYHAHDQHGYAQDQQGYAHDQQGYVHDPQAYPHDLHRYNGEYEEPLPTPSFQGDQTHHVPQPTAYADVHSHQGTGRTSPGGLAYD